MLCGQCRLRVHPARHASQVDAGLRERAHRSDRGGSHLIIGVGAQQAQDLSTVVRGQAAGYVVDDPSVSPR